MNDSDAIEKISLYPEAVQSVIRSLAKGAELIRALQDQLDEIENEQLLYGAAVGL